MSHLEKLDLRFLQNKTETFLVSVTHLILRFAIVQNKFKQTNKTKINHINDNHNKFEVSLHFLGIWPTVWRQQQQAAFSALGSCAEVAWPSCYWLQDGTHCKLLNTQCAIVFLYVVSF